MILQYNSIFLYIPINNVKNNNESIKLKYIDTATQIIINVTKKIKSKWVLIVVKMRTYIRRWVLQAVVGRRPISRSIRKEQHLREGKEPRWAESLA